MAVPVQLVDLLRRNSTATLKRFRFRALSPLFDIANMDVTFFAGLDNVNTPGIVDRAAHLALPSLVLITTAIAFYGRYQRNAMLDVLGSDFLRTARAKGLRRSDALIRHGLPNVGLSVITVLGLQVAGIIVGAVIIEQLFSLPGIGRMLVDDVGARDLPKVQGELLALTGFVLIVGFFVDLLHRILDPRQREAS